MVVISAHIWYNSIEIMKKKSGGRVVFLGVSMEPPHALTEGQGTLCSEVLIFHVYVGVWLSIIMCYFIYIYVNVR